MFDLRYSCILPLVSLTEKEKRVLEDAIPFRQVPKKFILADEGRIAKELYFIVTGLVQL
jgi:CRP/FNR family transcriptional regulator, anaerobic regulatory protein